MPWNKLKTQWNLHFPPNIPPTLISSSPEQAKEKRTHKSNYSKACGKWI